MWCLEEQECGENSDPKMNESKLSISWFTHHFSETSESNFLFLMYLEVVSKSGSCCFSLWDAGTPSVYQHVWQIRLPLVYFFFSMLGTGPRNFCTAPGTPRSCIFSLFWVKFLKTEWSTHQCTLPRKVALDIYTENILLSSIWRWFSK